MRQRRASPVRRRDDHLAPEYPGHPSIWCDLPLCNAIPAPLIIRGNLVVLVMQRCRRDGVRVDQFDGGYILGSAHGIPAASGTAKPEVAERFHGWSHPVLLGDHDALLHQVRLSLAGVQRGLMIDIVQRMYHMPLTEALSRVAPPAP